MQKQIIYKSEDGKTFSFFCEGCNEVHFFNDTWEFNNDFVKPTVNPSILVTWGGIDKKCHSFIREGNIEFLNDCTHDLKGTTVPLKEF